MTSPTAARQRPPWLRADRRPAWIVPLVIVMVATALAPLTSPLGLDDAVGIPFGPPSPAAPLGTDHLGRDVLSHLLAGGWGLLAVASVIAVLVTVFAAAIGAFAALRPRIGTVIELATDGLMLVPPVLAILLLVLASPGAGAVGLVVIAVLIGTPYSARVFAAASAGIAASGYVEVAAASGERLPYLIFHEVLPNLGHTFRTQLGLRFVEAIYLVSTAAFLQLPTALGPTNWAEMIRENGPGIMLNPWAVVTPSLAIALLAVTAGFAVGSAGRPRRHANGTGS